MFFKIIISFTLLLSSSLIANSSKPTLIFYCGTTMVKPIKEMAKIIEAKYNCNIKISQGASKDLYDSLKYSKVGDLFLPGSNSYRTNNLKDGYLLEAVEIGYNKAAIFVRKDKNKQNINLDDFVKTSLSSILCNPKAGSIGRETKEIFEKYKGKEFFYDAYDNSVEIGTDSRNLNKALIDKRADITINWRSTAFWEENNKYIDIIEIDEKYAKKEKLKISLLKFSQNKDIAKSFMKFSTSKQGQEIMKKYGFL
ncbi:molybdenum ABC transporter substrate-binding protein [Arcobacter sp. CECT 8983]|uniref:substrate-binding domain-containing protein n=1 Tax=Arcobacter sp. CECT 8983 TaxID=2044508 RepID=UPI00100BB49D|nr:substrate-binding domain-containing protein [Arcobacter sp. CECT 8983]RXJ91163.1 molybdenum ABC transporter substrate-binding protein [Arcobacter sp. CECT 8983]